MQERCEDTAVAAVVAQVLARGVSASRMALTTIHINNLV